MHLRLETEEPIVATSYLWIAVEGCKEAVPVTDNWSAMLHRHSAAMGQDLAGNLATTKAYIYGRLGGVSIYVASLQDVPTPSSLTCP